jgi:hypothetical protein
MRLESLQYLLDAEYNSAGLRAGLVVRHRGIDKVDIILIIERYSEHPIW